MNNLQEQKRFVSSNLSQNTMETNENKRKSAMQDSGLRVMNSPSGLSMGNKNKLSKAEID